jgi:hypothetical protein
MNTKKRTTEGTPIETKQSKVKTRGGWRSMDLIEFDGEYLDFTDLANHQSLKDRNLNYMCIYNRFNDKTVTCMEDLLRKKHYKRPKSAKVVFSIINFGHHRDRQKGEIFAGYLSSEAFKRANFWGDTNQRLGIDRVKKGSDAGKFPYFVLKAEILKRGWIITPLSKSDK